MKKRKISDKIIIEKHLDQDKVHDDLNVFLISPISDLIYSYLFNYKQITIKTKLLKVHISSDIGFDTALMITYNGISKESTIKNSAIHSKNMTRLFGNQESYFSDECKPFVGLEMCERSLLFQNLENEKRTFVMENNKKIISMIISVNNESSYLTVSNYPNYGYSISFLENFDSNFICNTTNKIIEILEKRNINDNYLVYFHTNESKILFHDSITGFLLLTVSDIYYLNDMIEHCKCIEEQWIKTNSY